MQELKNARFLIKELNQNFAVLANVVTKTLDKNKVREGLDQITKAIQEGEANTSGRKALISEHKKRWEDVSCTGYLLEKGLVCKNRHYEYEWYLREEFTGREFKTDFVELFINKVFIEAERIDAIVNIYLAEEKKENALSEDEDADLEDAISEENICAERREEIIEEIIEDSYKRVESYEGKERSPKNGVFRHDFISSQYGGVSTREILEYIGKTTINEGEYILLLVDVHFGKIAEVLPDSNKEILKKGLAELIELYGVP